MSADDPSELEAKEPLTLGERSIRLLSFIVGRLEPFPSVAALTRTALVRSKVG